VVAVSFGNHGLIRGNVEKRYGLNIARAESTQPGCPRNIQLSGLYVAVINAVVNGGTTDPCAITDLGTESVARILAEQGVPHLSSPGDANLLRRLNACALLDDQTLRRVPTLNPTQRNEHYGGWGCSWGSDPYADGFHLPAVDLFFEWVKPLSVSNGELARIGGRDVYIAPGVGASNNACIAHILYRNHPLSDGQRAQEPVRLAVYSALPTAAQCQLSRDVAATVISKLPPP